MKFFKKGKRKKSEQLQEPELPPIPPVRGADRFGEGAVDEYEKISVASSKVLAVLGVADGGSGIAGPAPGHGPAPGSAPAHGPGDSSSSAKRVSIANMVMSSVPRRFSPQSQSQKGMERKGSGDSAGISSALAAQDAAALHAPDNVGENGGGSGVGRGLEGTGRVGRGSGQSSTRDSIARRERLDHTQLLFETDFEDMVMKERLKDWAASFRRTDPRYMIMKYFNDIAVSGAKDIEDGSGVTRSELLSPLLAAFKRSAVFTVWRPTSIDAIRKMMLRRGTGKGLNIKGKSAKSGALSGYVPFVQIHDPKHKTCIRPLPRDARIRVFYRKVKVRDEAVEILQTVAEEMAAGVEEAKEVVGSADGAEVSASNGNTGCSEEEAKHRMAWWDADDLTVTLIDDYANNKGWGPFAKGFGVEVSERLFWEAFVYRQDITREAESEYDTGRKSEPAYQDMNFGSTRTWKEGDPRTVVWQHADPKQGQSPMEPRTLLVAYEENRLVLPVVSDFDCFLVGTRGVTYETPLPEEQVEMMNWCVKHIEGTLDDPGSDPWSKRWLDVLKKHKPTGKGAQIPRFGYGDPKSYSIMESAVGRLGENGAVRHGAECFNFYFPQDLDDEYLVILGDADAGEVPWMYVSEPELRELLCKKIDKGFTFPINPKWVLADPGWKEVYDKLKASQRANVQEALDCWYPPSSGLRERIEEIYARHPEGFATLGTLPYDVADPSHRRRGTYDLELDLDLELEQMRLNEEDGKDEESALNDSLSEQSWGRT